MEEQQQETAETVQFLTLTLDNEAFAIEITKVREVMDYTAITKVPRSQKFIYGVINVRGNVITVMDLRLRLGMPQIDDVADACIIILDVLSVNGEIMPIGIVADTVQEVIHLHPDQIEPAPKVGTRLKPEYIKGIGKTRDDFVIILDIDKVFTMDRFSPRNRVSRMNRRKTKTMIR